MQPVRLISSLLLFSIAAVSSADAQPPTRPATAHTDAAAELPVTRVALYKNGVGFFEHAGRVTGNGSVTIDFTTAQLNDVLQSLTAIDLSGGRIAGAGYNSTTPLDQQLRALPLALGAQSSTAEFLNAIRGARVEVRSSGATITGRLLNVETHEDTTKDGQRLERRTATVVSDTGEVRTLDLTPATSLRLIDSGLHTDVTRYLELIASNRNQGLRHLTLQDNGSGTRDLRVSYISEVPIWKSTYRILLNDPSKATDARATTGHTATLQGWSVVDNTTGADWVNVQLSLIAGAPQSFIQPLSIPYYSRRPQIGLPQEAQLAPQTHISGEMRSGAGALAGVVRDASGAVIPRAAVIVTNTDTGVQTQRQTDANGGFSIASLPSGSYTVEITARGFQRLLEQNVTIADTQRATINPRLQVGSASQTITVTDAPAPLDTTNATLGGTIENNLYTSLPLSMGGSALHGAYGGTGQTNLNDNYIEGIPVSNISAAAKAQAAVDSFSANASSAQFDDYFEYRLSQPVTIRKNESAMVPILQEKIAAEPVTLWARNQPAPLRALWVTNTSALTLDRGSFSIVEDGNFAGEGLLEPIHAGEKRLLSYAVDQAVRVTTKDQFNGSQATTITAAKGVLTIQHRWTSHITYVIRNAASESRSVVVEHPVSDYTLDADAVSGKEPKPEETTPTAYRYKVPVPAGQTVNLIVREHRDLPTQYRLIDLDDSRLTVILGESGNNEAFTKALQPIFAARALVSHRQSEVNRLNNVLTGLHSDEERQRANVTALANTDKSSRERFVRELNATEDQIAEAQKDLASAEASLKSAKDDLANKIEALQFNETL